MSGAQTAPAMTPQQAAAAGRNGDSVVAHLTPGEISIPPQVQTAQLIAAIREAFAHFGISLDQFVAGSSASSRNPATGAPEYAIDLQSLALPGLNPVLGGTGPSNLSIQHALPLNLITGGEAAQIGSAQADLKSLGQMVNPPTVPNNALKTPWSNAPLPQPVPFSAQPSAANSVAPGVVNPITANPYNSMPFGVPQ